MEQLTTFYTELWVLYLIATVGFMAKRTGIFGKSADEALNGIILYLTLPALILYSLDLPFSFTLIRDFAILIILSAFILSTAALIARFYVKKTNLPLERQGVQQGLIIFGNQGFLGYAICQALFGKEGIMYLAVFNLLYLGLIWTYGIYLIAGNTASFRWKKVILNPGTMATGLGSLVFFLPLEWPAVISKLFLNLGTPTVPLSMLLIGSFLADLNFGQVQQITREPHIWSATFFKLVLVPALLMPLVIFPINYPVLAVAFLISAMPSAPTVSLYAQKYGGDVSYASVGVCLSTLLLPFILPGLYFLLNYLYQYY